MKTSRSKRRSSTITEREERVVMATTTLSNSINPSKLFAAVDMGTNSFKMVVIRASPTGKFISIDRFKEPVVLGRGMLINSLSISSEAQIRAIAALQKFQLVLERKRTDGSVFVATSAVREALNKGEFLSRIKEEIGLDVEVIPGELEARFVYMGILQFLPVYEKTVVAIDIGGGSTEFVIGKQGKVIFATSLKLGHVSLTDGYVRNGDIVNMRNHIRSVLYESGLVEKVKEFGFEFAVGSSGTIRSIEKAVSLGYGYDSTDTVLPAVELRKDGKFNRQELGAVVEKLSDLSGGWEEEKARRDRFFKRRSEFILAGAVLLLEIFEILNIDEMEVSEYALGEGVVAETLASCCESYDISANAKWLSVTKLATKFNSGKRMKSAALCAGFAKEIFEGLRKCDELGGHQTKHGVTLDEKDLEYLEAACLLHEIGIFVGKKGYHKHSSHIIKNGGHLRGYNAEEVELIALLVRHQRKKFPKSGQASLHGFPEEVKEKFKILCAILRVSVAVQQYHCMPFQGLEASNCQEGFKLVFYEITDQPLPPHVVQVTVEDMIAELKPELDYFEKVIPKKLLIAVSSTL